MSLFRLLWLFMKNVSYLIHSGKALSASRRQGRDGAAGAAGALAAFEDAARVLASDRG
jgi:hypothetical protein